MKQITRRALLASSSVLAASLALAACSPGQQSGGAVSPEAQQSSATPSADAGAASEVLVDGSRTLVAYFSVPLTDDPNKEMNVDEENSTHIVDGVVLGNTQYVAQLTAERLGADLFRIETAEPLPLDYETLADQALQNQESGARPELAALIPNLEDYDTVFVGYPIWWYDMPMPLYSFFEQHDFSGKTVIPFTTHGGSRLSGTVERITELLPDSTVSENAFTISRSDMDNAPAEVNSWLDDLVQQ